MKKLLLGLIIVLVLAIAGGAYYLLTNLNAIVAAAIEKYGSQAAHTSVQVKQVDIRLKEGSGAIYGLTVANPGGFEWKQVFSLGEIKTGIQYESLKQQPYVIREVTVRAPEIFVEINKDRQMNLNVLKKNLQSGVASGQSSPAGKNDSDQPRLMIKKLVFEQGDIQVRVTPLNSRQYKLKLPPIYMENLGGKHGATATQIANEILNRLIEQVKQRVKQEGIDAELNKFKAEARQRIENEKQKLEQKSQEKIEQEKQKAQDQLDNKLKDLLGK